MPRETYHRGELVEIRAARGTGVTTWLPARAQDSTKNGVNVVREQGDHNKRTHIAWRDIRKRQVAVSSPAPEKRRFDNPVLSAPMLPPLASREMPVTPTTQAQLATAPMSESAVQLTELVVTQPAPEKEVQEMEQPKATTQRVEPPALDALDKYHAFSDDVEILVSMPSDMAGRAIWREAVRELYKLKVR